MYLQLLKGTADICIHFTEYDDHTLKQQYASGKLMKLAFVWVCACVQYLISEFADELSVVVVRFDDLSLATGKMRGTLNEIGPQGTLGQENLFRLQIHFSYHFICHL